MVKKNAIYLMSLIIKYGDRMFFYGCSVDEEMQNKSKNEAEQLEKEIKDFIYNKL